MLCLQVNLMTSFNSASFPDSLAIAKESGLTIGSIDEIQKLHIRAVPLGEQARRLAHQDASHTFLITTSSPPSSNLLALEKHVYPVGKLMFSTKCPAYFDTTFSKAFSKLPCNWLLCHAGLFLATCYLVCCNSEQMSSTLVCSWHKVCCTCLVIAFKSLFSMLVMKEA